MEHPPRVFNGICGLSASYWTIMQASQYGTELDRKLASVSTVDLSSLRTHGRQHRLPWLLTLLLSEKMKILTLWRTELSESDSAGASAVRMPAARNYGTSWNG